MNSLRRLIWSIGALVAIVFIGTIGYELIEGWALLDSIYMTITTITTVGFREVHPLSDAGRIFSIVLIIFGVGGALYVLTNIMGYILEGQFGITVFAYYIRVDISGVYVAVFAYKVPES